jgi:hypothetical protein
MNATGDFSARLNGVQCAHPEMSTHIKMCVLSRTRSTANVEIGAGPKPSAIRSTFSTASTSFYAAEISNGLATKHELAAGAVNKASYHLSEGYCCRQTVSPMGVGG